MPDIFDRLLPDEGPPVTTLPERGADIFDRLLPSEEYPPLPTGRERGKFLISPPTVEAEFVGEQPLKRKVGRIHLGERVWGPGDFIGIDPDDVHPNMLDLPERKYWGEFKEKGFVRELGEQFGDIPGVMRKIPLAGMGPSIGDSAAILLNMRSYEKAMEAGTLKPAEEQAYQAYFTALNLKREFLESQGYSFGGRVAQILANLPTFMAEFKLSGGLAAGAKGLVGKGGAKVLQKVGTTAIRRAAIKGGAWAAGRATSAAVRVNTALLGRAINTSLQRMLPETIEIDDKGKVQFKGGESAVKAAWMGWLDTWIEALSEELGEDILKVMRVGKIGVARKLPRGVRRTARAAVKPVRRLKQAWLRSHPGRTAKQFANTLFGGAGFQGTVPEILEERAGDVMRAVTGVEEKTIPQALWPGMEQIMVEATAFAVPGAFRSGVALVKSVRSKEPGARERARSLAERVAEQAPEEKQRTQAERVAEDLKKDEAPDPGLLGRVIEEGEALEAAEQTAPTVLLPADMFTPEQLAQQPEVAPGALEIEKKLPPPPEVPPEAEAPHIARYKDWLKNVRERMAQEEAVESAAELLEEEGKKPTAVLTEFWRDTYPRLNAWGQRMVRGLIAKHIWDIKPGDIMYTEKTGKEVRAENYQQIVEEGIKHEIGLDASMEKLNLDAPGVGKFIAFLAILNSGQEAWTQEARGALPAPKPVKVEAPPRAPREISPEQAEEMAIKAEEMGLREIEGKKGHTGKLREVGGTYQVRVEKEGTHVGDIPLSVLVADQIADMQSEGERVEAIREYEEAEGPEAAKAAVQAFYDIAPQKSKRSGLGRLYGVKGPTPTAEAGGIAGPTLYQEYERLTKLLPKGIAKQILRETIFWREGTPISVSPEKLEAWVERTKPKPKRAFYIGAVAQAMQGKQLLEYIKTVVPAREYQIMAKALQQAIKARTPGQVNRVIDSIQRYLEKHDQASALAEVRGLLKKVRKSGLRQENRKRLEELLGDVAVTKPSPKVVARAKALMRAEADEIRQRAKDEGLSPDEIYSAIPAATIAKAEEVLARAARTPIAELSSAELQELARGIETILQQDRLKNKLLAHRTRKTAQEVAEQAAQEIEDVRGDKVPEARDMKLVDRLFRRIKGGASAIWENLETLLYRIAGDGSTAYRILWGERREADERATRIYNDAYDQFLESMKSAGITRKDLRVMTRALGKRAARIPTDIGRGRSVEMTAAERIAFFLAWMDPSTRDVMRSGKGINLPGAQATHEIDVDDAATIIDQLTTNEKVVAKTMSAILNGPRGISRSVAGVTGESVGDQLNRVWRDVFGFDIATREGYFPRRQLSDKEVTEPNQVYRQWEKRYLEQQTPFKPRAQHKDAIVLVDAFQAFDRTMKIMGATAARLKPAHDMLRLLGNKRFRTALTKGMVEGDLVLRRLEAEVQDWIMPERTKRNLIERLINWITRNFQVGALGLNVPVVAYQTLSYPLAVLEIPAKYLAKAVAIGTNKQAREEMRDWSAMGWARITGSGHNIVTPGSGISGLAEKLGPGGWGERLREWGMGLIHGADTQVMYRLWTASKLWAEEQGFEGDELMRQTARKFQQIVDRTQPTWDMGTLNLFQRWARKTPAARLIPGVMFGSQRNKITQMVIKELSDWAATGWSLQAAPRAISRMALPTLINALGLAFIKGLWDRLLKGPAKDPEEQDIWIASIGYNVLQRVFGSFMVAGDILNIAVEAVKQARAGRPPHFENRADNMISALVADSASVMYHMARMIQQEDPEKFERARDEAMRNASRLVAPLTGIPLDQITRTHAKIKKRLEAE